jgi:prophage tail gpP-like protein
MTTNLKNIRAQIEQERKDRIEKAKKIKKYCNFHGYSDVTPYEVVEVISDQTVVVREMDAVIDPDWKMEAHVGGFAAHVVNNGGEWIITSNPENTTYRARWSKAKGQWQIKKKGWDAAMRMHMADEPNKFYDYNF